VSSKQLTGEQVYRLFTGFFCVIFSKEAIAKLWLAAHLIFFRLVTC